MFDRLSVLLLAIFCCGVGGCCWDLGLIGNKRRPGGSEATAGGFSKHHMVVFRSTSHPWMVPR